MTSLSAHSAFWPKYFFLARYLIIICTRTEVLSRIDEAFAKSGHYIRVGVAAPRSGHSSPVQFGIEMPISIL